jgi:D-alanyl-lipoteichoic acid acyltransferase DltB (MBOAT superfamily)
MLFNSYAFVLGFLPVALVGFFAACRFGRQPAGCWLVAASLVFYGWWNPANLPVLLASVAGNFAVARLIGATAPRPGVQGAVLAGGIGANLAALAYCKYWAGVLGAFGIVYAAPALPLGISFFTFTQIGYLIDCRQGLARDRSALDYALFVTFFPHLIAGPILHNREVMPQFAEAATYRFDAQNLAVGITIFLIGLLKKCVFADQIGAVVAPGFAEAETLAMGAAWLVALSYSLQLYFDFSGYSDMAIGLARMLNVRFPQNFASPYKAQSVIEYWQRWHMSLTRWLTLFLYNPLALAIARRRPGLDRRTLRGFAILVAVPTCVTMGLAGIWHGCGPQFLVFGLLHATYLTINHACRTWRRRPPADTRVAVAWRVLLTYLAVLVGAVFFRAASVPQAVSMLAGMAGLHGAVMGAPDLATVRQMGWLLALYAVVWGAPNTQQILHAHAPAFGKVLPCGPSWMRWQPTLPWAMAFGCAATLGLLSISGTGEFLYFQF